MLVKAIFKNKDFDYFRDKTTSDKIENQVKRYYGDVFECDDELALERIKKGFVVEVTDEEARQYVDSIDTICEDDDTQNNNDDGNISSPIVGSEENTNSNISNENNEDTKTDDKENNVDLQNLEDLSFKELKELAKSKDLKYVGVSKVDLIKSISELENVTEQ